MKRLWKRAGAICAVLLLLAAVAAPLCAARGEALPRPVRVGYFDCGAYYQAGEDGAVASLDAEYLARVAEYANLTFEYVYCGT